MTDMLAQLLAAIDARATEDTASLDRARAQRTAATNSPFQPVPVRPVRRSMKPTYRDPTAARALGRITKEKKP